MNFVGCIPRFLKKNATWILTAAAGAGVVGTAVLTAKAAPEAKDALYFAEQEKMDDWLSEQDPMPEGFTEWPKEAVLSKWEKIKVAAPIYLPAILTGTATIACLAAAQIFNVKQQATLAAGYMLLAQEFDSYRKAVTDEIGEEREKKIFNDNRAKIAELTSEIKRLKEQNGPFLYTFATLPGVVFEAQPKDIYETFAHYFRNLAIEYGNTLGGLYKMLGLPEYFWKSGQTQEYGWECYENEVSWGSCMPTFEIVDICKKDNVPVYLIDFPIPPYKLGLDYGSTDRSPDNIYEGYDPEMAIQFAKGVVDNDVVRFEQPERYNVYTF